MSAFVTALLTTGLLIAVFAIPVAAYLSVRFAFLTFDRSQARKKL
jgi:hypothetical protein